MSQRVVSTYSTSLSRSGFYIALYGLVIILLWIGLFKFTPTEAKAIQPLVSNSPLMSWMYSVWNVQQVSNIIGGAEIITALLLALSPWNKKAALAGGLLGSITFISTISFLFTTPGAFHQVDGFWVPDAFLLKDLVLLGVSMMVAGSSLSSGPGTTPPRQSPGQH
ncbi:MAG TPA: DUF417 family protein [Chitinophaga sp.]|uniref:YkgB family protein n=1 Tax=Chitinophaga sp. TaxID=1869181 RepID=UPI002B6C13F6|nr:DUF417 family protein [Chitinophaga sp.]HVI47175.1 DUF417 family protein [Chitinophaga sp.]